MKIGKITASILILLVAGVILTGTMNAQSGAGTQGDPLVSKSYVDGKFEEIKKLIQDKELNNTVTPDTKNLNTATIPDNRINSQALTEKQIGDITSDIIARVRIENSSKSSDGFKVLEVQKGKVLIGKESTEVILRSGVSFVYSMNTNGISDITDGKDLLNGETIVQNHLMITPRSDGRGVIAMSDCWFLVKGDYDIK